MGLAFSIFRVVRTALAEATKAVLLELDSGSDTTDRFPEAPRGVPAFGALGLLFRPRRPTKSNGQARHLEAYGIDDGGGVVGVAYRDLRLNQLFPSLQEGEISQVGYGGAFVSNRPTLAASGNVTGNELVIYVPYAFDGEGVPTKAHTIEILGGDTPSIALIHGEGMAITAVAGGKNSIVMKNKAGDSYVEVNDDGIVLNGNVQVTGSMVVGNPATAVPAMVGAAAPGAPSAVLKAALTP